MVGSHRWPDRRIQRRLFPDINGEPHPIDRAGHFTPAAPKTGGELAPKWARCAAARILSAPAARTHLVVAGSLFSCVWVRIRRMSYCFAFFRRRVRHRSCTCPGCGKTARGGTWPAPGHPNRSPGPARRRAPHIDEDSRAVHAVAKTMSTGDPGYDERVVDAE
jgi:hypothetical protein